MLAPPFIVPHALKGSKVTLQFKIVEPLLAIDPRKCPLALSVDPKN